MKYAAILLIAAAIQFPQRTVCIDKLESNHYGQGGHQLICWEKRPEGEWPVDWTTQPTGQFDGHAWHDANGKTIVAREYIETVTVHDPERVAFHWWRSKGCNDRQGGVWR